MSLTLKGTAYECLTDFYVRFPSESSWAQLTSEIGIKYARPYRKTSMKPEGLRLLRLEVFLDLLGYEVSEFKKLQPLFRQVSQLLYLGILSVSEATDMLGYSNQANLLKVLLRGKGMQTDKAYRLQRYVDRTQKELQKKLMETRERLRSQFPLAVEPASVETAADESQTSDVQSTLGQSVRDETRPRAKLSRPKRASYPAASPPAYVLTNQLVRSFRATIQAAGVTTAEIEQVQLSGQEEALICRLILACSENLQALVEAFELVKGTAIQA